MHAITHASTTAPRVAVPPAAVVPRPLSLPARPAWRRDRARRPATLRGDIQGLRALAILLVLCNHAGVGGLRGGYVGVDVFFVVSGFLITGVLVREIRRTGRVSIADFYARRARRILPAATVTLLVVVLFAGQAFTYARVDEVLKDIGWAAVFAANVHSSRSGSNYFDTGSFVSPVQHFWSLAVEEQFYLLWPAVIAFILYAGRRQRIGAAAVTAVTIGPPARAATSRRLVRVAVAITVLSLLSFAWSVKLTVSDPQSAYFSTLTRGWELGAGAALALAAGRVGALPSWLKATASWAGLAAIAVAATGYSAYTSFPGYHALLPVAGSALVLAGGLQGRGIQSGPRYGAAAVLDRQPLRWIGDISYSLYLWHWPLLVLPPMYLGRHLSPIERTALMAAAIAVAALSYRFVETPVRRTPVLRSVPKALLLWPAAVAVVIAAALVVHHGNGMPPRATGPYVAPSVDPEPQTKQQSKDTAANDAGFAAELARAGQPLPGTLRPTLDKLHDDVSRAPAGCYAERDDVKHRICTLGEVHAKRSIVLFGDSHVTMWLDPLQRLAKTKHWRIVVFMKASCLPVDATEYRVDKRRPYTECDEYREWAYAQMARLKPDRILISGLLAQNFAGGDGMLTIEDARPVFAAGAQHALARLRTISKQVYVLGGTPNLTDEPAECLATRKATMATCAVPLDQRTAERNAAWQRAAVATGAKFVNPVPWFCSKQTCPLVIRDVIVYRDNNHVTKTFAGTLRIALERRLNL